MSSGSTCAKRQLLCLFYPLAAQHFDKSPRTWCGSGKAHALEYNFVLIVDMSSVDFAPAIRNIMDHCMSSLYFCGFVLTVKLQCYYFLCSEKLNGSSQNLDCFLWLQMSHKHKKEEIVWLHMTRKITNG